jgi:hypothetical protein
MRDVVDRVKCEIWEALTDYVPENDPPGKEETETSLEFLNDWNASVSLTLTVDEQSSIAPGVSFINPLTQVVDKTRGTFPQSFSFGLGVE